MNAAQVSLAVGLCCVAVGAACANFGLYRIGRSLESICWRLESVERRLERLEAAERSRGLQYTVNVDTTNAMRALDKFGEKLASAHSKMKQGRKS